MAVEVTDEPDPGNAGGGSKRVLRLIDHPPLGGFLFLEVGGLDFYQFSSPPTFQSSSLCLCLVLLFLPMVS